jgi:hypothetical protein
MILADDTEILRSHRLGGGSHRLQQRGDGIAVGPTAVEQIGERRARHPGGVEQRLLLDGARQPPEFRNKLADGATAALLVLVVGDVGGGQSLEPLTVIPVRGRRVGRQPLAPSRIGRPDLLPLAVPVDGQRQMGIEPGVVLGDL